jgi:iron complex transport system ATP-binding protein
MPLQAAHLSWGYRGRCLGTDLDLAVAPGQAVALVGPNGAGKTTLLRTLGGLLAPRGGTIRLSGEEAGTLTIMQRARQVALLPQELAGDESLTVRELVEIGRTPHLGLWGDLRPHDREAVERALVACQLIDLASRRLDEVSGGERQRARIALVVAQDAPLLLLDEPSTHLDLRSRHELFDLLRRQREERGLAIVMVLHDLAEAYHEADRVYVLHAGHAEEIVATDPRRSAKLADAFGVPEDRLHLG